MDSLKGKKVLVTGAGGFIGSHLLESLLPLCGKLRALTVNHQFSHHGWLDTLPEKTVSQVEIVSGDVRDSFGMQQATKNIDVVFHLAAIISIPFSYTYPQLCIDTNIHGTLNILQAAKQSNVEKVVVTSTSEVYGTAQSVPITEEHPLNPQSPYAASKCGADHMALSFYHSFSLPVVVVRPFNTYGPRQSTRAIIPTIITQLAAGNPKIRLGSTHTTRDFNFVKDTTDGFIKASISDKAVGEVIQLASNFEISIQDLAHTIGDVMECSIDIETDTQRLRPKESEVERLWGDNQKAASHLQWKPEFGGLDGFKRGLKETIDWYLDKRNLDYFSANRYTI